AVDEAGGAGADARDRIEDALHRPLAQARVAVEGRHDRAARHRPHHQPAAGSGIAEIEHASGLAKSADSDAVHAPFALAGALDARPERAHGLAGIDDVL